MGLADIKNTVSRGMRGTAKFLGRAYHGGMKFASNLDRYAGLAKNVVGAVAPMVGELAGPVGGAVGAAVGAGMKGLGAYDRLKTEAMSQANMIGNVAAATKRGIAGKY